MVDDVRLAVLGAAPVEFIGGVSLDSSGFGIAPDLDVAILRRRILEDRERRIETAEEALRLRRHCEHPRLLEVPGLDARTATNRLPSPAAENMRS